MSYIIADHIRLADLQRMNAIVDEATGGKSNEV